MICVAISDKDPEKCIQKLESAEMAEIRLDLTGYTLDQIEKVFSFPRPLIATCRAENTCLAEQKEKLIKAIESGARYVDIEIEVPDIQKEEIISIARKNNCRVIISYHNFLDTPGLRELFSVADDCYQKGADVAKIVTTIRTEQDNARILAMYSIEKPIVALGMGDKGKITRIMAPFLGAEFSFAASNDGVGTAPGQITQKQMKTIVEQIQTILKNE